MAYDNPYNANANGSHGNGRDNENTRPFHARRSPQDARRTFLRQQNRSVSLPYPIDPVPPPPNYRYQPREDASRSQAESSNFTRPQIPRKPVSRATISEGFSSIRTTLTRPLTLSSRFSVIASNDDGIAPLPDTGDLLAQASRSLNCLASQDGALSRSSTVQSPPPYSQPHIPLDSDVKRPFSPAGSTLDVDQMDIFLMIRQNRAEAVQKLLEAGASADEVEEHTGRTPIMVAAALRKIHICHVLLSSGCRLHLKDHEQNTALHCASSSGDAEICRLLVEAGAQLEEFNREGKTPLQLAAREGHTEATECLLNCWTAQSGSAAALINGFIEASKSGNISTARAFIDRGVKPKKLRGAWRLVGNAAASGSQPMLDFLLGHRTPIKDRSPNGWTALHFAASTGQTSVAEKLLSLKISWKAQTKDTAESAAHIAIRSGHTSTAIALINHKDANVSVKDVDDQTLLHYAVRADAREVVNALFVQGTKLEDVNAFGWTPLHIAVAYGHTVLAAELVTRGANLEAKLGFPNFKPAKKTYEASKRGYWAEARWPHPGARALHLSIEFGHDDISGLLIANGAKLEEPDSKQWTTLHYAVFHGRRWVTEFLLDKGVSPHASTSEGRNALGLGFRQPGLNLSNEEKEQISELVHSAMHARKKSMMKRLTKSGGGAGTQSREAAERDRCWHTAELAAALCQAEEPSEELNDDALSVAASSIQQEEGYVVVDDGDLGPSKPSRTTR